MTLSSSNGWFKGKLRPSDREEGGTDGQDENQPAQGLLLRVQPPARPLAAWLLPLGLLLLALPQLPTHPQRAPLLSLPGSALSLCSETTTPSSCTALGPHGTSTHTLVTGPGTLNDMSVCPGQDRAWPALERVPPKVPETTE